MNHPLLIQWTDIKTLGIPIIDDQHRGIVSVINSLAYFTRQNKGDYFLNTALAMMESYIKLHFTTEEDLFRAAGYAQAEAHQRLHSDLIRESFFKAGESFRLHDPRIYLEFLKNWWSVHINREDPLYAETVKRYIASLPASGA